MAPQPKRESEQAQEPPEVKVTTEDSDVENTSSDAAHSTYSEVPQDKVADENPPPGPQVEQTRGQPTEASD